MNAKGRMLKAEGFFRISSCLGLFAELPWRGRAFSVKPGYSAIKLCPNIGMPGLFGNNPVREPALSLKRLAYY